MGKRETHWHRQLKNKARMWLITKGFSDVQEEVRINGALIIDVVGINSEEIQAIGIECGSLNNPPSAYKRLVPFEVLHMSLKAGLYPEDYPHRFGGCPYCT